MQSEKYVENDILDRAKKAVDDNYCSYARFLFKEALAINPENNAAREGLHNLRSSVLPSGSVIDKIKIAYYIIKIFINNNLSKHDDVIKDVENLLELSPENSFATKQLLRSSYNAGYYKLTIFIEEKARAMECDIEDIIIIAKAYLSEKIFDKAAKIAKEATELDADNEEAKDVLWKASVEKHMNSDVQLVTADRGKRFVPPKIDAEKIFISSHKDKSKNKDEHDERKKKEKGPVTI